MPKEIVINAEEHQTRIAIVENGDLAELYIEDADNKRTIGNLVLGRVRKVMPSIRAAFVDIGQESDAFLHFSDVSDNLPVLLDFLSMPKPDVTKVEIPEHKSFKKGKRRRPSGSAKGAKPKGSDDGEQGKRRGSSSDAKKRAERRTAQKRSRKGGGKHNSPQELLKRGQTLLVKIVKEPIANKGSRISTDISIAGRFLVLIPFSNFVAVSRKISTHKERRRLKALAKSLLPDGCGAIVRTVAEGRNAKALDTDLRLLLERWRRLEKKLERKPKAPVLLHEDVDMVSSVIRDLFSSDYDRILIDNERLHRSIKGYVQAVAPQMAEHVELHSDTPPVFEAAGIRLGAERAFERRVELPSGGYLFIERTEAMHVVDVNSGRSGKGLSQEQNSLQVDLEAARVIAHQIRLRDLGGIIVVDFIDLRSEKNRRKVYDELKKEFKKDRAVTKVLPMSDFGLVQITRQRLRPSITTTFSSANGQAPTPSGQDGAPSDPSEEVERLKDKVRNQRVELLRLKEAAQRPSEEVKRLQNKIKNLKQAGPKSSGRPPEQKQAQKQARRKQDAKPLRPEALVERLEAWLAEYKAHGTRRAVTLQVHPFTAAFLHRGMPSYPTRWFMKYLVRVRIEAEATCPPLSFRFIDARTGEDVTKTRGRPPREDDAQAARAAS